MIQSDRVEDLISRAIEQLGDDNYKSTNKPHNKLNIEPSQVLVLAGLLGGVLEVTSIVIRKNQMVEIVLTGSLKKNERTELERLMTELGKMPFDDVVRAMLNSLK